MSLGDKQKLFARLVPRLIDKTHELGLDGTSSALFSVTLTLTADESS